jgi:hypothetical protein
VLPGVDLSVQTAPSRRSLLAGTWRGRGAMGEKITVITPRPVPSGGPPDRSRVESSANAS